MARYAAFLRGMNLGGRRITNRDLAAAVTGLGFEDVETFRASGNVIFAADGGGETATAVRLGIGARRRARLRGPGLPPQRG